VVAILIVNLISWQGTMQPPPIPAHAP
jgi:hypothetical protein